MSGIDKNSLRFPLDSFSVVVRNGQTLLEFLPKGNRVALAYFIETGNEANVARNLRRAAKDLDVVHRSASRRIK